MPLGIPDTRAFPWDQSLKSHLGQLNNGVTGGINTWSVPPTVGPDGLALGTNQVGYTGVNTSNSTLDRWNGTGWSTLMFGYKLVATPQLDVYVNQATGNDANDGMTASTAWKTISKFYQEVAKYNLLSKQTNLYLGAGTYSIVFPPSLYDNRVRIIGASNASVTIQGLSITNGTFVLLQDVTVAYPQVLDSLPFYWPINVNAATIQFGPNIIFGAVGNHLPGNARFHLHAANKSGVQVLANCPITLTGSVNCPFFLTSSSLWVSTYYNPSAGASSPNAAPGVDTGATYTASAPLTSSDTVASINASGSVAVGSLIIANNSSSVSGPPGWRLNFTGSITGSAYTLSGTSNINGLVVRLPGTINQGILYPTSISSGTIDASSITLGVYF